VCDCKVGQNFSLSEVMTVGSIGCHMFLFLLGLVGCLLMVVLILLSASVVVVVSVFIQYYYCVKLVAC